MTLWSGPRKGFELLVGALLYLGGACWASLGPVGACWELFRACRASLGLVRAFCWGICELIRAGWGLSGLFGSSSVLVGSCLELVGASRGSLGLVGSLSGLVGSWSGLVRAAGFLK